MTGARVVRRVRNAVFGAIGCAACLVPSIGTAHDWTILTAEFQKPTTRYAHGVLGDDIEYGQLAIEIVNRATATGGNAGDKKRVLVTLPETRVFEDIKPRLWDVTGDSAPEIVVVESSATQGAQLAIYDGTGQKIAATPHIGTANRWLAPVGAADLDRDGHIEIAYVDRPHLTKTLRIWRFQHDNLTEIAHMPGFSNHRIGWDYILGGVKSCAGQAPELILPTGDWINVAAVRLEAGRAISKLVTPYSRAALNAALTCP